MGSENWEINVIGVHPASLYFWSDSKHSISNHGALVMFILKGCCVCGVSAWMLHCGTVRILSPAVEL